MSALAPIRYATSRDGTRIAWTADSDDPSLIFVPPWPFLIESEFWKPKIAAIFGGGVVWYERRGFGRSDWGVEHSLERYTDDLEAVADAAGMKDIALYGAAAGTLECVMLAARTPRVVRMVLGEPHVRGDNWNSYPAQQSLHRLLDGDFATFWRAMLQFSIGWGKSWDIEKAVQTLVSDTNPEDIRSLLSVIGNADVTGAAPMVQAECLLVHNADDPLKPPKAASNLARLIPNARLLITSGGRWSRDDSTTNEIRRFLGGEEIPTQPSPNRATPSANFGPEARKLSQRETEILGYVASGATNQEIADALTLSKATIARHLANLYVKLGVHNRVEATAWALSRLRDSGPTDPDAAPPRGA